MTSQRSKEAHALARRIATPIKCRAPIDPTDPEVTPPPDAVPADRAELAHNNNDGGLPRFYLDTVVVCRDCGKEEIWPAERQKWWYEVAKGNINATAVRCRACRHKRKHSRPSECCLSHCFPARFSNCFAMRV
ncbi:zinc-ribbon domain containing protein [Thiorhodococcus minor]|uniref:Probable zinc-binding domain-containing protein n=1 Tax=Thiorhodococcus minor TaxID=57489 RepID=A0A6M0K3G4_9GAMM|nr:zinc-ribbon domain containing protein [Thiorhodococcus minor]NEV64342.1 hypothetical protein [Thiorhodococcus minor]